MQIFPSIDSSATLDFVKASDSLAVQNAYDNQAFKNALEDELQAEPVEITPDTTNETTHTEANEADESLEDDVTVAEMAYDDDQGDLDSMDIRFTQEEVNEIAESLEELGVSRELLEELKHLGSGEFGASLLQVVQALAQKEPVKLTDSDMTVLSSLANRLGQGGANAEALLDNIRNGDTMKAWSHMAALVESQGGAFEFSQKEALTLGKALGLSNDTLDKIAKTFNGNEKVKLDAKGFAILMNPAQNELMKNAKDIADLASKLEEAISPVLADAKERMQAEADSASLVSKKVQQQEFMLQDKATAKSFIHSSQSVTQQEIFQEMQGLHAKEGLEQAGLETDARLGVNGQSKGQVGDTLSENLGEKGGQETKKEEPKNDTGKFLQQASQEGKQAEFSLKTIENPWDSLIQRLDVSATSSVSTSVMPKTSLPSEGLAPHVAAQVEQGILTAQKNGTTRLQLQLNGDNLGHINIVLTSKNGEVSALLRPEQHETSVLLEQQVAQLKATLEEQGIKVEKVEVQTQLKDDQGQMSWQGAKDHNEEKDFRERVLESQRMQALSRRGMIDEGLIENLHTIPSQTRASLERGVYVVA